MIIKDSVASFKYTLDASTEGNTKLIATSAREILGIIVTAETADMAVGIYDNKTGTGLDPKTALFVNANQGETMPIIFTHPVPFKIGVFVQIEQGGGPFNGKVTLLMD